MSLASRRDLDINYITTMRTYLGEFEQLLLFALVQLDADAYGGRIRELIEARTGRTVSPGALYTALDRLEQRGLVSSSLGEATAQRGGKRKRYYRIEPTGAELLRRSHEAVTKMARGLAPKLRTS
jgi:DNA-binding PadR family transcriptional regulator